MEGFAPKPHVLYQAVDLCVDMCHESISGHTLLWLGFREEVKSGQNLFLHCRQARVQEVYINSVPCKFVHNDPLKSLNVRVTKYCAADVDSRYRAALEISRTGELQIEIPDFNEGTTTPIPHLPRGCSREVVKRYEKLMKAYDSLTSNDTIAMEEDSKIQSDYIDENIPLGDPKNSTGIEKNETWRLLQLKIIYALEPVPTGFSAGYTFRFQSYYCDGYGGMAGRKYPQSQKVSTSNRNMSGSDSNANSSSDCSNNVSSSAVCVYSTNGTTNGTLRNIDGIRCWLPCIDEIDQRAVYDINMHVPKGMTVVSCGVKVSCSDTASLHSLSLPSTTNYNTWRFFTGNRIPAMTVGFFVGSVEGYQMPLYKLRGNFLVATNIVDFAHNPVGLSDGPECNQDKTNHMGTNRKKGHDVPADSESSSHSSGISAEEKENHQGRTAKKARFGSQASLGHDRTVDEVYRTSSTSSSSSSSKAKMKSSVKSSTSCQSRRLLYEDRVQHSLLGFEMTIRHVQKFVGHRYDHDSYTQVYIPHLGFQGFLSFDGFSFVDSKYLHLQHQTFLELSHHMVVLTAYLYSWLKSSLPINNYVNEFIVHGAVGYLVNLYAEFVYGEEDGKFRYIRSMDHVIQTVKMGRGVELASNIYPENYDHSMHWNQDFITRQSVVLFHIIENRIGGKESMRKALQNLIKSPLLLTQPISQAATLSSASGSLSNASGSLSLVPPLETSWGGDCVSPRLGQDSTSANSTPREIHSCPTPSFYSQHSCPTPSHLVSPYPSPFVPASPWLGAPSPHLPLPSPHLPAESTTMPPTSTTLVRQISITSDPGWEKDLSVLYTDLISDDIFIRIIRDASGVESDLSVDVLKEFVNNIGVTFLKVDLALEQKKDNKPRNVHIFFDQIGVNHGQVSSEFSKKKNIRVRMVESRDSTVTEPDISIGKEPNTHTQPLFTKQGRRGGRAVTKATGPSEGGETVTKEKNKRTWNKPPILGVLESSKNATDFLKDIDYAITFLLIDPYLYHLVDCDCSCLPDFMLIEQLFTEVDVNDPIRQLQAIRSLSSKVKHLTVQAPSGADFEDRVAQHYKTEELQLKAFADCIRGYGRINHCTYVRSECVFALAKWQNDRAPMTTKSSNNLTKKLIAETEEWVGLGLLLLCLRELFIDTHKDLQPFVLPSATVTASSSYSYVVPPPRPIDFTNEPEVFMRNAMLLALSTIKSGNGHTPKIVIKWLLNFLEHSEHVDRTSSFHDSVDDTTFDDTHYKSVLLLCLSRVKVEIPENLNSNTLKSNTNASGNNRSASSEPSRANEYDDEAILLMKIVDMTKTILQSEITNARASARIQFASTSLSDDTVLNPMPLLAGEGLLIASALTCLGEIDAHICSKCLFLPNPSSSENSSHQLSPKIVLDRHEDGSLISSPDLNSCGLLSGLNYVQFFLPGHCTLQCVESLSHLSMDRPGNRSSSSNVHVDIKAQKSKSRKFDTTSESVFPPVIPNLPTLSISTTSTLCPPTVRSAALEAFVQLCFTQHIVFIEKAKDDHRRKQSSSSGGDSQFRHQIAGSSFIPAAIEAVLTVIQNDPDRKTRQEAANILLSVLQNMPCRIAASCLTMGEPWMCMGFADCNAFTLQPTSLSSSQQSKVTPHKSLIIKSTSSVMKKQLSKWWEVIHSNSSCPDETIRCTLLTAWIYTFGEQVPKCLESDSNDRGQGSNKLPEGLTFALTGVRLTVRDPMETYTAIQTALTNGSKSQQRQLHRNTQSVSSKMSTSEAMVPEEGRISSGLKLSLKSFKAAPNKN